MKKNLSRFDLFPSNLELNFFGEKKISSQLSLILSFASILLTILMAINFSSDLINKSNPIISRSERNYYSNKMNLGNKKERFIIGLGVVLQNKTLLSENVKYYPYLYYNYYNETIGDNSNFEGNLFSLFKFEKCGETFKNNDEFNGIKVSDIPNLKNFDCFDLETATQVAGLPVKNFELEGDLLRNKGKYVQIIITLCPYESLISNYDCTQKDTFFGERFR